MNIVNQFEGRASRSRSMHEGESSTALCDRLSRTRETSPRQLPTDHDHAVPTREYQIDQSSPILLRLLLALPSKNKSHPTAVQRLTGSLHIRAVPRLMHLALGGFQVGQGGFSLMNKSLSFGDLEICN